MVIDIIDFFNPEMLLLIVAFLVIILIFLLIFLQRRIERKRSFVNFDRNVIFEKQVDKIKRLKETQDMIQSINSIAREFIRETYHLPKNIDYAEMIPLLIQKEKREAAKFCERMLQILYSGEEINLERIAGLTSSLRSMIHQESIFQHENKKIKLEPIIPKATKLPGRRLFRFLSRFNRKKKAEKILEFPEINVASNSLKNKSDKNLPLKENIDIKSNIPRKGISAKNNKEYQLIESLDRLDRIEGRLRNLNKDVITKKFI